jgi:hypothetical protein
MEEEEEEGFPVLYCMYNDYPNLLYLIITVQIKTVSFKFNDGAGP